MYQREWVNRKLDHNTTDNIITIENYFRSNLRIDLLNDIVNYDNQLTITLQVYYDYLAALIDEILFRSAQRSGVVIGMRRIEVQNAKIQKGHLNIVVYAHKTGKTKSVVVFLH